MTGDFIFQILNVIPSGLCVQLLATTTTCPLKAGIHTEGLSALDLLKRLNYINEYAKQKAARKAGVPGTGGAHPSAKINATADVSSMVDDDDDEDVDGVPLDENAVAAVSDASSSSGQSKAGILGPAKGVIAPTSTPRPGKGRFFRQRCGKR